MEIGNNAISEYLVSLATNINAAEKFILIQVVEILFNDIALGHSCSNLHDITKRIEVESSNILALLNKSGLMGIYDDALWSGCVTDSSLLRNDNVVSGNDNQNKNKVSRENIQSYPLSYLKNGQLLFITKYLQYEISIAVKINVLNNNNGISISKIAKESLKHLEKQQQLNDLPNAEQLDAIKNSLEEKLSIITGGPGTGKTTTIIFLLWLFYKSYGANLKIKLGSPTGKATKRVQESIAHSIKNPDIKIDVLDILEGFALKSDNFLTLHRLLGVKRHSIYFRHDENNQLDIDILIIDESSMISLPMFSKLLKAIDHNKIKHIIFLGDKNQLSSVEEGYVFATIVDQMSKARPETNGYDLFNTIYPKIVSALNISKRNTNDIGQLASGILANDKSGVMKVLNVKQNVILQAINFDKISNVYVEDSAQSYLSVIQKIANLNYIDDKVMDSSMRWNDIMAAADINIVVGNNNGVPKSGTSAIPMTTPDIYKFFYEAFTKQVILSVTNVGPYGTDRINSLVEKRLKDSLNILDEWYVGRAILILENNYTYNLSNGDIGFCIKRNGAPTIIFSNGLELIPEALPRYSIAYAITIHKSQGSEYNSVNIVLNNSTNLSRVNDLLSRELIYTAVTRGKNTVNIFGDEEVLLKAIANTTHRNSGLKFLLENY